MFLLEEKERGRGEEAGRIRAKRGDKSKGRLRDQRKEANFEAGSGETEQGSEGEKQKD